MVVHFGASGMDAAGLMSSLVPRERVEAILLSRPGYLSTEPGDRLRNIDQQTDLYAALLDALPAHSYHAAVRRGRGGGLAEATTGLVTTRSIDGRVGGQRRVFRSA